MTTGLLGVSNAYAHRVNIFAWVDGDMVHTQSKFSGGKTVVEGRINVYDSEGELLLQGETDDKGEFSFRIPRQTTLKIELIAGMGHQSEWTVHENEMDGEFKEKTKGGGEENETSLNDADDKRKTIVSAQVSREEMEAIVEKAVEKKLKPLIGMLADLKDSGPGIPEIIGGIGYIIGLAGIAAYFRSR